MLLMGQDTRGMLICVTLGIILRDSLGAILRVRAKVRHSP
jgi:hypothetical protein